jgi:putative NIF3 family GTP cyclohydrolase 1 type 2
MKIAEVFEYLKSLNGGWVDYSAGIDAWKAGDPEAELTGIAVGWMSYTRALEEAARLSCNLFITHEPTFYDHWDRDEEVLSRPRTQAKAAKIRELGMTILRCHDLWDQYPGIGIPDSWGRKLGLGEPVDGEGYYRVYDGGARSAREIAQDIAAHVKDLGQEAVQLIGSGDAPVRRIVIGTGAITPFYEMITRFEADLAVCTDDGFTWWRDGAFAIDNDLPVVVVNHPVAEIHGMELLAEHLAGRFGNVPVRFIEQSCMYRLIQ